MYVCEHFKIYELVPPDVYYERQNLAWELMDDRLLITLDRLRERYGMMIINNWHWGGDRYWSGLRTPGSPFYRPYSQHTFGRAADCLFLDLSPKTARKEILENINDFDFELISGVELGVGWLHIDVRNCERIKKFYH